MIVKNFKLPQSSFMSVDKDLRLITEWMIKNNNLCKILYYTDREALSKPALTEDQKLELFGKQIKIVPKLYVDGSVLAYVIISMDNFTPSENPQFRDNMITFDIICHFDQWQLKDFQLRPYRIAAEIDSMFNEKRLTGIGKLHFLGANQIILNDEFAGLTLMYQAIHGGEDKKGTPNPADEEKFIEDFNELYDQEPKEHIISDDDEDDNE